MPPCAMIHLPATIAVCWIIVYTGLWELSDVIVMTLMGLPEAVAPEPATGTGRTPLIVISICLPHFVW